MIFKREATLKSRKRYWKSFISKTTRLAPVKQFIVKKDLNIYAEV